MDSHLLVKLAHMLHGVCFAVINGKGWLLESSRKCSPFYVAYERWFGELIQCPAYDIFFQAPRRWAFTFTPPVVLFFVRKYLAWGSSRSSPIVIIAFIIGGYVRARMRPPSLCIMQLSLQIVYLSLHGLLIILSLGYMALNFFWLHGPVVILSLEHVTADTRMASAGLSGVHTSLSKPSILFISITLRVGKVTLLLGSSRFRLMGACLMRAWSYHAWLLPLPTHKFFPQTAPIVGTGFEHFFY